MERKLMKLFDYQKFARNENLQKIIDDVHERYASRELSMNDMDAVYAAGVFSAPPVQPVTPPADKK